jgi:hypothetical protein
MALFLLDKLAAAADTDGDGVPDGTDVCCTTPTGIAVDAAGRPLGDLDLDCDVDQSDFGVFQRNMTGSLTPCPALTEVCDGQDNDCDCVIDDGNPGGGATCNTGQLGVCAAGTTSCSGGTLVCNQNLQPSAEICDNLGVDNDCDGNAAEGACPPGRMCCGDGVCAQFQCP